MAPDCILQWVLPTKVTRSLIDNGCGPITDLICAKGVPDNPSPYPTTLDHKTYNGIIVEIGLCRDLGRDGKHAKKSEKYYRIP